MAIHLLFFQTVLLFLSGSNCLLLKAHLCSCPLLGNLLSLQIINVNKYVELDEFSSPIGESIFSTLAKARENARLKKFSSPIGESIFSTYGRRRGVSGWFRILVPYWGIYFLYQKGGTTMFKKLFSSPIGESIFSTNKLGSTGGKQTILVPYRGIYFLYIDEKLFEKFIEKSSRPLSGNLFSLFKTSLHFGNPITNSRPLSGNLFSL